MTEEQIKQENSEEEQLRVEKSKQDLDNNRIVFSMPRTEYEKSAWRHDYLTILFYDSETGMFLTKPYMREAEKKMQAEYLSLNEWKELKELNKTMRNFTRTTFDLIGQKFGGMFSSPMMKLVIIVIVVMIIIGGLIMFFPQIQQAVMPAVKTATGTASSTVQTLTPAKTV